MDLHDTTTQKTIITKSCCFSLGKVSTILQANITNSYCQSEKFPDREGFIKD